VCSVASLLLAASLVRIPFSSSLEVRLPEGTQVPERSVAGDFLVLASRAEGGSRVVTLRPLALGDLAVPLPGAQPSRVEVVPSDAADARVRPPVIPAPPAFPWGLVAVPLAAAALAALAVVLLRRRRRRDPLAELEDALHPLASPAAWTAAVAPDRLAGGCRAFLAAVTAAPCAAMTTRELSRLLAARVEAGLATPFALALVLADEARFAGMPPPAEVAVEVVRQLLAAAPALAVAAGGRR